MSGNGGASGACKFLVSALGVLIALLGLALGGGGIYLATLGGSLYFVLGGLLLLIAGGLIAA
ncbi:hypothetical protein SB9_13755, partial [Pseudomonas oryzihabitans]